MSARTCPECARSFGPHYTGPCGHGDAVDITEELAIHNTKAEALAARLSVKYPAHNFRTDEARNVSGEGVALVICWTIRDICCIDARMSIDDAREECDPAAHGIAPEDADAIAEVWEWAYNIEQAASEQPR